MATNSEYWIQMQVTEEADDLMTTEGGGDFQVLFLKQKATDIGDGDVEFSGF